MPRQFETFHKSTKRFTTHHNNVVYKIDCKNCDAFYVGQTKRMLETRAEEHRSSLSEFGDIEALYRRKMILIGIIYGS